MELTPCLDTFRKEKEMLNGVKDYAQWKETMTQEQRDYKMFEVLCNLDKRLEKLESKSIINKTVAFFGGIVGGISAYICVLVKSLF